jgi:hypothetical protein
MLVSKSIPHLANGISQQPPSLRLTSQGESQSNCYSSVVEGLKKRPPTHSVARVINGTLDEAYLHTINRDLVEKYKVIFTDGAIQVFDLEGNEKTVNIVDDDGYLDAATPSESFRAVTISDYTVVANKEVTVLVQDIENSSVNGANKMAVQINNNTTNTVYNCSINFPEGGLSNTGNAWNGTALEWSYTVTAGQTMAQVATAINTAMQTAGSSRDISEFVACWTDGYVLWFGTKRYETSQAHLSHMPMDLRISVNGTIAHARETGSAPTNTSEIEGDVDVFSAHVESRSMVFVKQGNYGMAYTVAVPTIGVSFSKTTANTDVTDISTTVIASSLNTSMMGDATYNAQFNNYLSGSLILVVSKPDAHGAPYEYTVRSEDGNGNKNLAFIKDTVQKFSFLPEKCFAGFRVKVNGDATTGSDDYYVSFNSTYTTSAMEGTWIETGYSQPSSAYRAETMPHVLVREADGMFSFRQADWEPREAGDAETNPEATFVDQTISDIFFWRNRLGFIADDNYILSCAGDYFNFFRTTVQTLLDGDPIDVAASSTSVSILRHAVPWSKKLVLFSDQEQFIVDPGDLLTPRTANALGATRYEVSADCRPVSAGTTLYFVTPRGDFHGVREYAAIKEAATDRDDAQDVTAHVPSYIPEGAFRMFAATEESVLGLLTSGAPSKIYVYKWFWVNTDKLQSSWSEWDFGEDATILDAAFINLDLHLVIQRQDGVYLETLNVSTDHRDEDMEYEVLLDRRVDNVTGVYNSSDDTTSWTVPYADDSDDVVIVRAPGGSGATGDEIEAEATVNNTNTVLTTNGDLSAEPVFIGRTYRAEYEFSQCVPKEKSQGSGDGAPIIGGRLQVRTMSVTFDRTGHFQAVVMPAGNDDFISTFTAGYGLGVETEIGSDDLFKGKFMIPVNSKSDRVSVKIISDSWKPFRIQSAEWEGNFTLRSRRF